MRWSLEHYFVAMSAAGVALFLFGMFTQVEALKFIGAMLLSPCALIAALVPFAIALHVIRWATTSIRRLHRCPPPAERNMTRFSLKHLLFAIAIISMGCALGTIARNAGSPWAQNAAILAAGALVGSGLGSLVRPIAGALAGAFLGMILLPVAIVVWVVITS